MATPNYGFEKRQRELAKKQKKEEKLRAKAERKAHGDEPSYDTGTEQRPPGEQQPGDQSSSAD